MEARYKEPETECLVGDNVISIVHFRANRRFEMLLESIEKAAE